MKPLLLCRALALLLPTTAAVAAEVAPAPLRLSAAHLAAVDRPRRIFCQYDSASFEPPDLLGGNIEAMMRYRFGYADQPGSQIDAICLDVSNEGVAPYPSKILPMIRNPGLLRWHEQGLDYIQRMIEEGRKRQKEIWWNHRVNEVERGHGGFRIGGGTEMEERNPVKAQHPDWVIKSWWWQGHWNLAVPGVRQHKLAILTEVAERYEFDGFQLDFARHTPHLPPGRQWELRDGITRFVADVRAMLLARGAARGRPFLLAVRIPENLEGCRTDGYDVAEWARRNLVDIMVLGTRTMRVDLPSFRKITAGTNIKLLPSFDGWHATDGYQIQSIEFLRGVFENFWAQGADTVGTFNWAAGSPALATEIGAKPGPAPQELANSEVGSLATIRGKPRFYAAERRGGYPNGEGYFSQNLHAPLPVRLRNDGTPAEVSVYLWNPLPTPVSATLRLICFNHLPTDRLAVALNGHVLTPAHTDGAWKDPEIHSPAPQPPSVTPFTLLKDVSKQSLTRIDFPVPADALRHGANVVRVSVAGRGAFRTGSYIQVEKTELHLR